MCSPITLSYTHTHTHTHMHARTHACTHTHSPWEHGQDDWPRGELTAECETDGAYVQGHPQDLWRGKHYITLYWFQKKYMGFHAPSAPILLMHTHVYAYVCWRQMARTCVPCIYAVGTHDMCVSGHQCYLMVLKNTYMHRYCIQGYNFI